MHDEALLGYLLAEGAEADGIVSPDQEDAYWWLRYKRDMAELALMIQPDTHEDAEFRMHVWGRDD